MGRLFANRWTWVVIGALLLLAGGYIYFSAIAPTYTQRDGAIATYAEYTRANVYDRNELTLQGDDRVYVLHKDDFSPPLPDKFFTDGKVTIWYVDSSSDKDTIYAITLFDDNDENPQKHTTDYYDHPEKFQRDNQLLGVAIAGAGMLALLIGLLWPLLPWGHKPIPPTPEPYSNIPGAPGGPLPGL